MLGVCMTRGMRASCGSVHTHTRAQAAQGTQQSDVTCELVAVTAAAVVAAAAAVAYDKSLAFMRHYNYSVLQLLANSCML
jgi:hypothetical protein